MREILEKIGKYSETIQCASASVVSGFATLWLYLSNDPMIMLGLSVGIASTTISAYLAKKNYEREKMGLDDSDNSYDIWHGLPEFKP